MRSYFNRSGNKIYLIKEINKIIPNNFKCFVDVFVGSGIVFLNINNYDELENIYINDIDKDLINGFKLLKNIIPTDIFEKYIPQIKQASINYRRNYERKYKDFYYNVINKIWKEIKNNNDNSNIYNLILFMIENCAGFYGYKKKIYKLPIDKLKKSTLEIHKNKMKKVDILNEDYKNVIERFKNNVEAFLYLDPPYEKSKQYNNNKIDYEEMSNLLHKCKCNFLLSINDSSYIRNIFKDFYIKEISVRNPLNINKLNKNRKELFITNYKIL